ncbi:MAG: efflux RND transporter periplasmic adaptor subunit [Nitratireductor sp.]|nr:efflux RND transporter periplasmic adaptor subunit [Nitratireductor sp.]
MVSQIVDLTDALAANYVGTVSARIEADLGFPMIGTIAERPASQGDLVAKGDVLARLDPEDLDASVRSAESGVAVAEAQAASTRDARDRASELAARGAGAQTRLDSAERALIAADAQVEQARAALVRARDIRALATLTAPQDGIITTVYEEPGATVAAGAPVLRLSGTGEREIVIDLSERDTAALRPGTEFIASLIANPEVTARARLDRIDPVAERSTRTRRAHLRLNAPPEAFRLGALAHARLATGPEAAVVIPSTALLDPDTDPMVWVVDRTDNTVHRRAVTVGATLEAFTVIAAGLSEGDEIVTRGIHSLTDGQTVGAQVSR